MPDRSDISPLSITDGKISKGAKIDPTKLAPATSGQVLIAGTDGKFRPGNLVTTSSGDTVAQGPAGATGATGSQGATGITGATGAAGVDGTDATVTATTVNAAGAIMHTDVPDSDTGFVKRTGAETYDVDTATYSTTGHTHDDRYYTETEADTLLAAKSGTGHTHDDRYYTETEADTLLATKSATTHTHDGRYYTETETDTLLAAKSGTGHTHDDRYYTETEADTLLATKSGTGHTHDDRYYTETEADTLLATKSGTSHTHDGRYYTETEADTLLATKAASSHTHDDRYYTETEADTLLATKAATSHTHDDRYYTETEADTLLATKAASSHTHDSRYYQESEFLNASAGSGDAGKPVKLDADGQIDTSMINSGDVSFVDLDDLPSTFTPSTHSHDAMSSGNSYATGFVPAGSGTHADNFLRKDGTWVVPTGTSSYTADDGIGLTGTAFSVAAGTGLTQDSTGLSLNLQGVAETAVRVDQDYIVFLDGGSTGAAKKESIGDLATAMAGTGITAAAGELNASNSMGKYIRWITWGTTQSDITYNGDDSIATINHGLGSQYVTVALIDVDGVATEGGANSLSDVDYICIIKCIDTNNITIEWNMTFAASGDSVPANNDFKLTVIG